MTAAANETWIESSLERLEILEGQREQLVANGQTARLAEIDEEIRGLYEALESVAGDEEPAAAPANEAVAAPMAIAPPGFGASAAGPAVAAAAMDPMPASYTADIDIGARRSPLPMILGAVLVIGGGAAAFLLMNRDKADAPAPAPTGPAMVIQAGEIVEDTQEPQVAKGADGDRTRGTIYKESTRSDSSGARRPSSGSSRPATSSKPKKDDGRKITFEKGKDPLGGVE